MVRIGNENGRCKECRVEKNDLLKGFCYACRKEWGRRKGKEEYILYQKEIEKSTYDDFGNKKPKTKTPKGLRESRDWKIRYLSLKTQVNRLLEVLGNNGYSDSDITNQLNNFGRLGQPHLEINNTRRLLANMEKEESGD